MNNSGSVVLYGMMLGILIIILALALAPSVRDFTKTAMNNTDGDTVGLDCNNASISNYDKGTCIITDSINFYFIGALILIGGGFFTYKILF
jgi:hypothetical protein